MQTVQSARRGQRNTVRREEGESNRETPRQRLPVDNAIWRESEGRGGRGMLHPSRQRRPSGKGIGVLPTMISHGVEISIPGGEGEKVRVQNLGGCFLFLFFLYPVFIVTGQELACSASYGVKKTLISKQNNKVKPITDHLQVRQVPGASPT